MFRTAICALIQPHRPAAFKGAHVIDVMPAILGHYIYYMYFCDLLFYLQIFYFIILPYTIPDFLKSSTPVAVLFEAFHTLMSKPLLKTYFYCKGQDWVGCVMVSRRYGQFLPPSLSEAEGSKGYRVCNSLLPSTCVCARERAHARDCACLRACEWHWCASRTLQFPHLFFTGK